MGSLVALQRTARVMLDATNSTSISGTSAASVGDPRPHVTADRPLSFQWTQTVEPMGIRLLDQIQSMAASVTRTQPWEAG